VAKIKPTYIGFDGKDYPRDIKFPDTKYPEFIYPTMSNDKFIELLIHKVEDLEPFAFTRFGDGEIAIIKGINRSFHSFEVTCKNWGFEWPKEAAECHGEMCKILLNTLWRTDVLGVFYWKTNCYGKSQHSYPFNRMHKYLIHNRKFFGMSDDVADTRVVRSPAIGNPYKFADIIQGTPVHIVSPMSKILEEKGLGEVLKTEITYTFIPYGAKQPLSMVPALNESLCSVKAPIILWGGGAGNKGLGVYLRDNADKICIDMGGTLGLWAGNRRRLSPGTEEHHCLWS